MSDWRYTFNQNRATLIAVAAGVLSADAGEIEYCGRVIAAPDPQSLRKAGVSVTYQHPTLVPDLTVLENLQLVSPALLGSSGRAEAERLLREVATDELAIRIDRRVAELSLAQRHIVEIVRALSTNPQVLFFDEPALVAWSRGNPPLDRESAIDVLSGALAAVDCALNQLFESVGVRPAA